MAGTASLYIYPLGTGCWELWELKSKEAPGERAGPGRGMPEGGREGGRSLPLAMPPWGLLLPLLLLGESGAPPAWSPPPSSSSASPWCPFFEDSEGGGLCFRRAARGFECRPGSCREQLFSPGGNLSASVLGNGSVLLQWAWPPPASPPRGFRLSCSWEGPQAAPGLPCRSVRLGAACRDYLLPEAHAGIRYRLCLAALSLPPPREEKVGREDLSLPSREEEAEEGGGEEECVEFEGQPAGPRDIVVAMAAVGGAICVMLVLICLLVAYLTENAPPAGPGPTPPPQA
ncbi:fibronectin type III domain-containing protein 10 [Anolis sagrei]|uniref:fibronectin type III domain-containing protein 10 n=1 Tax=Anolis sagrei TaxID=38937 RepID=UPI003521757A